jgi:hypothetical protein
VTGIAAKGHRVAHALAYLIAARRAHEAAVRDVLATRGRRRCSVGCVGWCLADTALGVARCDECATIGNYTEALRDEDLLTLPEVRAALNKAFTEDADAAHG